jgi:hypothetical protein
MTPLRYPRPSPAQNIGSYENLDEARKNFWEIGIKHLFKVYF